MHAYTVPKGTEMTSHHPPLHRRARLAALAVGAFVAGLARRVEDRRPPGRPSPAARPTASTSSRRPSRASTTSAREGRRRDHRQVDCSGQRRFPFGGGSQTQQALGSGFVYDGNGHIVTNQHVVDGRAVDLRALLERRHLPRDARRHRPVDRPRGDQGERAGVDAAPARARRLERRRRSASGVVAIGSPFGLEETVTAGHRQRPPSRDDRAEQLHDRRLDPDRRRDQPRQLRRPAARPWTAR